MIPYIYGTYTVSLYSKYMIIILDITFLIMIIINYTCDHFEVVYIIHI